MKSKTRNRIGDGSIFKRYRNFIIGSAAAAIIGAWTLGGLEYAWIKYYELQHSSAFDKVTKTFDDLDGFVDHCTNMYINRRNFSDYVIGKDSAVIRRLNEQMNIDHSNSRCGTVWQWLYDDKRKQLNWRQ